MGKRAKEKREERKEKKGVRRDQRTLLRARTLCISLHLQGQRKVARERGDAQVYTVTQLKRAALSTLLRLEARAQPEVEVPSRRRKGSPGRAARPRGSGDYERGERPSCSAKA